MKIIEGTVPFHGYQTWYRLVGECTGNQKPLVLLHGGPGSTHNYFELLDSLARQGRALLMYDQLGCGNSYLDGHPELWNFDTWDEELLNLLDRLHITEYHLLGQSWGGMLAMGFLLKHQPDGCRSVILSSTLSSASLWAHEQHRLITFLSEEEQAAIAEAEKTGEFSSEAYQKANAHFMVQHCAAVPSENDPECLRRPKKSGSEAYLYGWGPNEYNPTGSLGSFEITDRLNELHVPALIMSGTNDLCTPLVAKTMYDHLPDAEWHLFDGCRHMCFAEHPEEYQNILNSWMLAHD